MSSGLPGPGVSFHDVELRTVISVDLVSVAVVVAIGVPVVTVAVFTRH